MTSESNKLDIEKVSLDSIIVLKAAVNNGTQMSSLEDGKHEFDLTYNFQIGLNRTENILRYIFSCGIKTLNEKQVEIDVTAKFDIAYLFKIDNLEELITINESDDSIKINDELITILANICYSTSRGIIYTKCQGTIIKNLIIPILPTSKLVEILQPG